MPPADSAKNFLVMPKIQITTTDGSVQEFDLTEERARIGRAEDNDFVVRDGSVSSYHGEILSRGSGIEFHDLGSTNGTHVNGQRVESATLAAGEEFRLGSCHAVVVNEEAAAESEAEAPAEDYSSGESSYEEEASSAPEPSFSSAQATAPVLTGLGTTSCPTQMRTGFGQKVKTKKGGGGMIMLLGVLGLAACGAAAFMILQMGA